MKISTLLNNDYYMMHVYLSFYLELQFMDMLSLSIPADCSVGYRGFLQARWRATLRVSYHSWAVQSDGWKPRHVCHAH